MPSDAFCVSICIQWSLFCSQVLSSGRSFECRRASHPTPVPPEWSGQREVEHCMSLFLRRGMLPSAPVCGCGVGVTNISQGPAGYTRAITQGGGG